MKSRAAAGAVLLLLLVLPLFVKTSYLLHIVIVTGMFLILALSYDLVVGHVGLLSLAHPTFFGIGAYLVAVLADKLHLTLSFPLVALLAALVAMAAGYLVGIPSFRLSSHAFAMGTLGFGLVAQLVANNWISLTDGPMCLAGIPPAQLTVFGHGPTISSVPQYYYLMLGLAVLALLGYRRIVDSRIGRSFAALRQGEALAAAFGINVQRYKMAAFVFGAAAAGVAGAFYAHYTAVVCPDDMGLYYTINLLVILFAGGAASLRGVLLGAVVFTALPEILRISPNARMTIYGALLLIMVLFFPGGLNGMYDALRRRLGRGVTRAERQGG